MTADEDTEFKHCDDYIDDEKQPKCLRAFLDRARQPAHGHLSSEPFPKLFATYKGPMCMVSPGDRVRVTMASRLGDVGVTRDLTGDGRYTARCFVEHLTDFSDTPEVKQPAEAKATAAE